MPSLVVSESQSVEKTMKNSTESLQIGDEAPVEKKVKKEKKSSKKSKLTSDADGSDGGKKKKEKKRKSVDDDEEKSETSAEMGEPMNLKKKKMKFNDDGDEEEKVEEENPNALSNFRISKPLKDALVSKGIEALFPIQAMTFNTIFDGSDLVGRARTGQVLVFNF